jgi:CubicO group peptidase (beta-lactamase class C family)
LNTKQSNIVEQFFTDRRVSRRRALGYGSAGLAASALGAGGLIHSAAAQSADATPAAEPSGATPERVAAAVGQLESISAEMLKQSSVPGLAVAVVHQDKVVHLAGYGERKAGSGDAVDADTVFQLASVSKCLAATTVAAAVGDGAATWDARMSDLDPAFAMYDAWVTREVTIADLFSHRSGLADHGGDDLEDIGYDRAEVLHRLRYLRPEGPFRAYYAYTNFGLTAAALAVASAAGDAWEDLAAKRLYQPLGMTSTSSRFADFAAAKNRAYGHILVDGVWTVNPQPRQPDAQSPAGGVSSTVRDLGQWLRLVLGQGTIDGKELVAAAALGETFRPHSISNPAANPATDRTGFYGLGWNVSYDANGRVRLSHSGAFGLGAATAVYLVPSEQLGLVVLTNGSPVGLAESFAVTFLDLALTGAVAYDYLSLYGPAVLASVAPKYGQTIDYTKPPADPGAALALTVYAGDFTNDYYGDIAIAVDGDALTLHLGPKQTPYPMRHYAHDVFLYQPVGENAGGESAVSFAIGADGSAASVTIEILDIAHQGTFVRPAASA